MKLKGFILACLSFCMVSCVEPLNRAEIQELWPLLDIWIELPDEMAGDSSDQGVETKANITTKGKECYFNEIQIWAFDHADAGNLHALPIGYAELDGINKTSGSNWNNWNNAYKMQIRISSVFLESYDTPRADFYVLANWKCIYDQDNRPGMAMTLGDLRALKFGAGGRPAGEKGSGAPGTDNFGPADGTCWLWSKYVEKGKDGSPVLPMSAIHNNNNNGVDLTFLKNAYENFEDPTVAELSSVGAVKMQRAVTKISFLFSKPAGMQGVTIRQVVLDGGMIPKETNVFQLATQPGKVSLPSNVTYHDEARLFANSQFEHAYPLLPNKFKPNTYPQVSIDIGESVSPENLKTSLTTQSDYYSTLEDAIANGSVIEMVTYLRETDKQLSGKIYYSVGDETHENESDYPYVEFKMQTKNQKHFRRNYLWSVYAFFLSDEMRFVVDNTYWGDEGAHKPEHSFN